MTYPTNITKDPEIGNYGAFKTSSIRWKPKVYHLTIKSKFLPEWRAIEQVIKIRDKHTCQSCGIKTGLTVHHILSRNEGGTDYPPNLITLCKGCHNEIEELGFKVKEQIIDYKRKRKYIKQGQKVTHDNPIKWQQWVYGGFKRPI